MGATIPLGMLAIRGHFPNASQRSFSFLYLANVMGAVAGAVLPPLLIEVYGFRDTLRIGALLNGLLFVLRFCVCSPGRSWIGFALQSSSQPADGMGNEQPRATGRLFCCS